MAVDFKIIAERNVERILNAEGRKISARYAENGG
jgi:hypothetical protein